MGLILRVVLSDKKWREKGGIQTKGWDFMSILSMGAKPKIKMPKGERFEAKGFDRCA